MRFYLCVTIGRKILKATLDTTYAFILTGLTQDNIVDRLLYR